MQIDRTSIPISILDLSPIVEGDSPRQALRNTLAFAQAADRHDFRRFWLAEHHNMPGIASAATSVVIGYVAAGTERIRVGAGGVMLPNHAPLVIAEQFGTLEALYPGRIDLGLGRAPGTDQRTAAALRRNFGNTDETFPLDLAELQSYFAPARPGQGVRAVPGAGADVPIWLLGSSLFSARLAAKSGLRFAFASHFAPELLLHAFHVYHNEFQPSATLKEPYAMATVNIVLAETDDEARKLFTSQQQAVLNLRRGRAGQLPPPRDTMAGLWSPAEEAMVDQVLTYAFVGSADNVAPRLDAFIDRTQADEVMVTTHVYDLGARIRSLEMLAAMRAPAAAGV